MPHLVLGTVILGHLGAALHKWNAVAADHIVGCVVLHNPAFLLGIADSFGCLEVLFIRSSLIIDSQSIG